MTYMQKIQQTRAQVAKGERIVEAQRDRLTQLRDDGRDTWAAKRLLTASASTLQRNRNKLRQLLSQ